MFEIFKVQTNLNLGISKTTSTFKNRKMLSKTYRVHVSTKNTQHNKNI
jgi:hypothetical protein